MEGGGISTVKSHQLSGNVIKSSAWETLQVSMSVEGLQGGSPGPRGRPFSRPEGAGSQFTVTSEGSFPQPACIFPKKDLPVTPDLPCLSSLGGGGGGSRETSQSAAQEKWGCGDPEASISNR